MADIVNLNRFRKTRARADAERQADENRIRFGRTKAEKLAAKAEEERQVRELAGKQLETDKTD